MRKFLPIALAAILPSVAHAAPAPRRDPPAPEAVRTGPIPVERAIADQFTELSRQFAGRPWRQ